MAKLNHSLDIEISRQTRIRTLSIPVAGPFNSEADSHVITHGSGLNQWNTLSNPEFSSNQGFDIEEGRLRDTTPFNSNVSANNNTTSVKFAWIPQRGRLLLYIKATKIENTYLYYSIAENNLPPSKIKETKGQDNTVLICPRDEGIGDNEPMTITLWRTRENSSGSVYETSDRFTLWFHTYAEPKVRIAHPKNVDHSDSDDPIAQTAEAKNYPLIANEVINRLIRDDIKDVIYVCPVLSLMLSQDGLDDSGLGSYTRVSISEYKGTYGDNGSYTGTFHTPSNDQILNGTPLTNHRTGTWTGVFRDSDGSVISLSGMNEQALQWTPENKSAESVLIKNPTNTEHGWAEEQPHAWPETDGANLKADLRVCFRAGYKYKITVRRFHAYAAGFSENNDSYSAYLYNEADTDYPCPHGAVPSSFGSLSYGPAPDFDIAENNANNWNISSSTDKYMPGRNGHNKWVGPYGGENGATAPGFSDSETIIIDCVKTQTSRQNLVTVRPASQEVSADKWITFGYRHLNRTPDGFDGQKVLAKSGSAIDDWILDSEHSGYTDTNYPDIKTDGSLRDEQTITQTEWNRIRTEDENWNTTNTAQTYNEKAPCIVTGSAYQNSWEGGPTTSLRACEMYVTLMSRAINELTKSESGSESLYTKFFKDAQAEFKEKTKCDSCGETNDVNIGDIKGKITISLVSGDTLLKIYEDDQIKYNGFKFNVTKTQNFILNFYANMIEGIHAPTPGTFSDEAWQIVCSKSYAYNVAENDGTVNFSVGNYNATDPKGNEYTWIPIINAQDKTSLLPISKYMDGPMKEYADPNHLVPVNSDSSVSNYDAYLYAAFYNKIIHKEIDGEGASSLGDVHYSKFANLDKKRCISDNNTYDTSRSVNARDITSRPNPPYIWESNESNKIKNKDSDKEYTLKRKNFSTTEYNSFQYFATKNSSGASLQEKPGKLFLRVPVGQDCENGNILPPENGRLIPTRLDYNVPTVRTSHLLFYRSYIRGRLRIDLEATATVSKISSHEDIIDEETGEVTGVNHGNTNLNVSKSQIYIMTNPGTGEYSSAISILNDVGKSVTLKTSPSDVTTIPNVLTVFGEDNNGLGRCLSANDYTSLNYIRSKRNGAWVTSIKTVSDYRKNTVAGTYHEGAIEVPIRVRYTPSAQPTISNDLNTSLSPKSDSKTNVISLLQCYDKCTNKKWKIIEYDSARLDNDGMKFKENFKVMIAYGLYNDKCKGSYKTVTNRECYTKQQMLQVGQVGMALPNTDYYPAVGICNGFAVILFPHDAKDSSGNIIDYFNKPKNWWSIRSNYEGAYKYNEAKPVIIADKVVGKVYETYDSAKDENNKLATTYELSLNYTDLFLNNNVINKVNTSDTRANKAVINTWYDLVVVPIFSDHKNLDGDDFKFADGAGTINGAAYGGGTSSATSGNTFYYGSNPMVIEKFVNFAQLGKVYKQVNDDGTLSSCGGGGGGGGGEDPTDPTEPPFGVNGCILYPNVNNIKFNTKIGKVKECPGFWLNNTFRVIIRAPHFRPDREISDKNRAYGEQSIETVSNGKLTDSKDFIFTDVMIHFGKYDDVVKVKEDDGSIVNDNVGGINNIKFSDPKFQDMINRNQLNPEWLNARNIYTVRINPDAWSKRVPSINDLEPNVRDLVKAGSLDINGSNYYDRMIEFNPNMVNAWTTDKEGFYIQVRFLNGEYATSSSIGTWSEWCGGIVDDSSQSNFKDKNLEYFVPIRSYNDVLTSFRNIQKEATPGAALLNTSDYSKALQGTGTLDGYKWVRGTGTSSRKENNSLTIVGRSVQEEGASPTNPKVIQSVGTTYIDNTVLYLRCGDLTSQVILSEPLRNLTAGDGDDNADLMSELRTYRRVKCYSIPSSDLKLIESNTYEVNLQDAFPIANDDSCPRMSTVGTVWDSTTEFSWKIQKKNGKAILTMKAPGTQTIGKYFQNTPIVGQIEFMYRLETPTIEKSAIPVELISSDLDCEVISEVSPTRVIIDKFNELSQSTAKYSQRGKTIHRSLLGDTYTVPAKTISKITAKDYNNTNYTVVEENTDYPYKPGILKDNSHTDNPAAEIPEEVIDNNQTYYEMNYIDYVITNMAKLYYTDYAEQKLPENNLTPKDFGWSAAKAVINQYKNWNNSVDLSDSTYTNMTSKSGNIVADKYFRKTITYKDFEELLEILKNLTRFTRDTNWTGKYTTITSPTENNVTTGDNVIPVDEETLTLDALKMQDSDNPVKGIISNDINRPTHGDRRLPDYPDGVDIKWKDTEHNLIDRLWYLVKNFIIKDSIPDKNK